MHQENYWCTNGNEPLQYFYLNLRNLNDWDRATTDNIPEGRDIFSIIIAFNKHRLGATIIIKFSNNRNFSVKQK